MPKASHSSSGPLIKGYLPVRVKLPLSRKMSDTKDAWDETFFYCKEHRDNRGGTPKNATLFVANAPTVPMVRTRLVLKSLLGRFADISRVTVIRSPRQVHQEQGTAHHLPPPPSFLPPDYSEGRFAYVVFASNKDLRKTLSALTEIMSQTTNNTDDDKSLPGLLLDAIEIQALADETDRQFRKERSSHDGPLDHSDDDQDNNNNAKDDSKNSIVVRLANRYRASMVPREELLEECNTIVEKFEAEEEKRRVALQEAASKPDQDGFVTVTYSAQDTGEDQNEDGVDAKQQKRRSRKRSRNKKKGVGGSAELKDFYRFQSKEKRRKTVQDLRRQFEEDLAKVEKMKEEKQFQPF